MYSCKIDMNKIKQVRYSILIAEVTGLKSMQRQHYV